MATARTLLPVRAFISWWSATQPGRIPHQARRECVDEHAFVAHGGKVGGDLVGDLVPEDVAEARGVGLRRAREHAAPARRQLEGVPDDALDALVREDARLDCHL